MGDRGAARRRAGKTPLEAQLKKLFSKPCIIRWSDGHESRAVIGDVFYTEEAYSRYRGYRKAGKAYPVGVEVLPLEDQSSIVFPEDPEGERGICETLSKGFTDALQQFVVKDPDSPLYPTIDRATAVFTLQAEETQRELQRLADEAPQLKGEAIQ